MLLDELLVLDDELELIEELELEDDELLVEVVLPPSV